MAKIKEPTKREKFAMLLPLVEGDEMLTKFVEHEIELLEAKSSKGSSKKSLEQEKFIDLIRDVLAECADEVGMQCGAIAKDERLASFEWADGKPTSSQRVSAMLKKMITAEDVVKTEVKGVSYFRLA